MLIALFQRIPHCVCEPLAVAALLGICLFLYRHWRKSRSETLLIAAALLFMIGWRVALPIGSDRYALFLVPFAIFFSVWGIRLVAGWSRRLLPRVPWAFLWAAGLLITAVCISFAHHEEDRAFFTLLNDFRQEIRDTRSPVVLWCNRELSAFLDPRVAVCWTLHPERRIPRLDIADVPEYAIFRLSRKQFRTYGRDGLDRELVAKVDGGGRKFTYCLWRLRRQFRRLAEPAQIEQYAASAKGNLLSNAGFETVRSPQETAVLAQRYIGFGADFYRKPDLKLPVAWNPVMYRKAGENVPPEFESSSESPIRGQYSLRIKVSPKFAREIVCSERLQADDYRWSLLVRAKKNARFRLFFFGYRNQKPRSLCNIVFCTIPADGTYYVSVPVCKEDLTGGDYYTAAVGGLDGEMFFDEVFLVPDLRADKR